jgi:predicted Zn-dependent peptidase
LVDACHRHLGPSGSTLIVAGAADPEQVADVARSVFDAWPAPQVTRVAVQCGDPHDVVVVDLPGAVQSSIGFVAATPSRADPAFAALALAVRVVGGTATSWLSERLRERRGYAYFANMFLEGDGGVSRITARCAVAAEVTAAAVHEIHYVLGRAATVGFDQAEVAAGARGLAGRLAVDVHTVAGLAEHLATMATEGAPLDAQIRVADRVRRTTADDARQAAAATFAPGRVTTVVVGDAGSVRASLEALGPVRVSQARAQR